MQHARRATHTRTPPQPNPKQALDAASLPTFLSAVCSTGMWEAKPFARRETTLALGWLAAPGCPAHAAALQAPALGRALGHVKKRMQV